MRRWSSTPLAAPVLCLASLLLVATAGCQRKDDDAAIEERLQETGTMDLLEQIADAEYEPPEDGRLSDEQMEMYLAVQRQAAEIRRVAAQRMKQHTGQDGDGEEGEEGGKKPGLFDAMRALGDLGDLATADQRAAVELGYNPAEYLWVQSQIAEARVAHVGEQMQSGAAEAGARVLASMEAQLESADNEAQREQLREQIRRYKENLEEAADSDPLSESVRHNLELVREYEEELRAVDQRNAESMS